MQASKLPSPSSTTRASQLAYLLLLCLTLTHLTSKLILSTTLLPCLKPFSGTPLFLTWEFLTLLIITYNALNYLSSFHLLSLPRSHTVLLTVPQTQYLPQQQGTASLPARLFSPLLASELLYIFHNSLQFSLTS